MVRVVGKAGALGTGVGGNFNRGMDGSKIITRRYPGRGKCLLLGRISIVGGVFKREKARKKKKWGGGGGKRFRSHIIIRYTPAMTSRIWSTLMFATLCVILRSRVLIIYVGAFYTRGAGSRRSCGVWGRRGRWSGGGGMNEFYVMDG